MDPDELHTGRRRSLVLIEAARPTALGLAHPLSIGLYLLRLSL